MIGLLLIGMIAFLVMNMIHKELVQISSLPFDEESDETVNEKRVLVKTIAIDIICIYLFASLVTNFVILLFSIVRLIRFLTSSVFIRFTCYILLLPTITCIYINQSFEIIAFNWGLRLYELYAHYKSGNGEDILYMYEYFQEQQTMIQLLNWSCNV